MTTQAAGLGATIRAWRDRLSPAATGLPAGQAGSAGHAQRAAARLGDAAVAVFAADWQLIWWNRSWAALLGDPAQSPPGLRNVARDTFPVTSGGPRLSQWPVISLQAEVTRAAVVSDLRRPTGRFPRDHRLAAAGKDR